MYKNKYIIYLLYVLGIDSPLLKSLKNLNCQAKAKRQSIVSSVKMYRDLQKGNSVKTIQQSIFIQFICTRLYKYSRL